MKCAMEMVAEATLRKNQIEEAERIKELKRIASAKENTLILIKEIEAELEKRVSQGKMPQYNDTFADCRNYDTFIYPIKEDGRIYANGAASFSRVYEKPIFLDVLKKHFSSYCFKVIEYEVFYKSYGAGKIPAVQLIITPDPECLK